ncbi:SIMPL domain-containing protein [Enterocloster clostridioformis]|uniref:SIMPL domain-containing protein n=1 Tax=Enterocloster clostridioformis TaxID=1531 RepID=UPI002674E570|nr:SIMPL domain-containing protein [Enterocloster clostridioformis]
MKHFMKRTVYTAGISAAVAAAALGLGGCAAGTQMPDTLKVQNVDAAENVITVTGREEVKVVPDMARIEYAVYTREDTAAACQEKNASDLNAAIETLKGLGVEETSIQTSSYGLSPIRNWNSDKQEITGYEMTTNLTVSDIPIDNTGTIIAKSVAAGVNGINSVSYFSSSYDASYQEALKGAMAVAQAKAQALAEAGAKTLAGVVHVEEFGYQPDTRYASYNSGGSAKMAAVALEDAGAPVMPGQVSVEAQVTVSYELNE